LQVRPLPGQPVTATTLGRVPDLRPAALVVLAAGKGTRMRSATPKVLHRINGRSLLGHVLAAAAPLASYRTLVVVSHEREQVVAELFRIDPEATPVAQPEPQGTGQATRLALEAVQVLHPDRPVLVVPGDTPLLTTSTLRDLVEAHVGSGAAATVLTAVVPDPTGYGRIVAAPDGSVGEIVEESDADAATRAITQVNAGVYVFTAGLLQDALGKLSRDNAQGEEYLTDVIGLIRSAGHRVVAVVAPDAAETAGVNDRVQLAQAGKALTMRLLEFHMRNGVTVVDPAATYVDVDVVLEADVVIHPGTSLLGRTVVQRAATVGPHSTIRDTVIRAGAQVQSSTCTEAVVGEGATVGPYSFLRPGTRLGRRAKVGAYVEVKGSVIGDESKVPHLSYVGDAVIGQRSNIGAGTIVVNYDGVDKHRTTVGDDARVGSNNSLVAPVSIGNRAYTGADAVIRHDVPAGALAYSENTEHVTEGWVEAHRGRGNTEEQS
jgi:bifunctional UDP-N-acetylglucosamine pyrophosphorylase/glucosamine-1-phosphate N-acetyltransferase